MESNSHFFLPPPTTHATEPISDPESSAYGSMVRPQAQAHAQSARTSSPHALTSTPDNVLALVPKHREFGPPPIVRHEYDTEALSDFHVVRVELRPFADLKPEVLEVEGLHETGGLNADAASRHCTTERCERTAPPMPIIRSPYTHQPQCGDNLEVIYKKMERINGRANRPTRFATQLAGEHLRKKQKEALNYCWF